MIMRLYDQPLLPVTAATANKIRESLCGLTHGTIQTTSIRGSHKRKNGVLQNEGLLDPVDLASAFPVKSSKPPHCSQPHTTDIEQQLERVTCVQCTRSVKWEARKKFLATPCFGPNSGGADGAHAASALVWRQLKRDQVKAEAMANLAAEGLLPHALRREGTGWRCVNPKCGIKTSGNTGGYVQLIREPCKARPRWKAGCLATPPLSVDSDLNSGRF
jgi:hypothetical protein